MRHRREPGDRGTDDHEPVDAAAEFADEAGDVDDPGRMRQQLNARRARLPPEDHHATDFMADRTGGARDQRARRRVGPQHALRGVARHVEADKADMVCGKMFGEQRQHRAGHAATAEAQYGWSLLPRHGAGMKVLHDWQSRCCAYDLGAHCNGLRPVDRIDQHVHGWLFLSGGPRAER